MNVRVIQVKERNFRIRHVGLNSFSAEELESFLGLRIWRAIGHSGRLDPGSTTYDLESGKKRIQDRKEWLATRHTFPRTVHEEHWDGVLRVEKRKRA